jgi:hypothetical protein
VETLVVLTSSGSITAVPNMFVTVVLVMTNVVADGSSTDAIVMFVCSTAQTNVL